MKVDIMLNVYVYVNFHCALSCIVQYHIALFYKYGVI